MNSSDSSVKINILIYRKLTALCQYSMHERVSRQPMLYVAGTMKVLLGRYVYNKYVDRGLERKIPSVRIFLV